MAIKSFRFAYSDKKLGDLLSYSLTGIVRDDLDRFDMPGITPSLDLLYKNKGLDYEGEVEFVFLPSGNGVEDLPVELVVLIDIGSNPGEEEAGLYAYSEFAQGLYSELLKQSEGDDLRRKRAMKLIQRYDLERYSND